MRRNRTLRNVISFILSLTLVMGDIPVLPAVITAQAAPGEEMVVSEDTISEDAVSEDEVTEGSASEDAVSNDEVTDGIGSDDAVPEDEVTDGTGSDDQVSEDSGDDGEIVVGGYIEMPWDNDTPTVDNSLDYHEALEMIVDENPGDQERREKVPELVTYVSNPGSIETKYPEGDDSAVLSYFKATYPATRSQSPYGSCWAHSAVSLAEFYLISHGLSDQTDSVDKSVNYSELQLAYFCYNQAPNMMFGDTGDTIVFNSDKGDKKSFMNFGGNLDFASQSMMRYNGVVDDDGAAAYSNADTVLMDGLTDNWASSMDVAHLKNEYHINIKSNKPLVKQAIKENGIVGISIYADEKYYNSSTNSYYNNYNTTTNHAVAIVGWNDSYPKGNFLTQPSGDGAWLIRNSWTENTGYSFYSYFWLSYYDTSLSDTAYVFEMADSGTESAEYYDNNYYYDSQLHNSVTAGAKTVANVFTSVKASETLKAVQIDSTINIPGAYTVNIYKNLSNSSDPESGTLESTTTGTLPFAGKYTIPLNSPVSLNEGETFSVIVTTENRIDQESDFNWNEQIVMDTTANVGESFYYSGSQWRDVSSYSSDGRYGNICIRALTDTNGEATLPDKITSISVKNRTEQSITLVWSAAKDATGYAVYVSDSENGSYTEVERTAAGEKKFKHTGLSAGTSYYYKVYPVKSEKIYTAGVSPVVSAVTLSAVPNVELVTKGKYTATFRWEALDNCDGYEYSYGRGNGHYPSDTTSENEVTLYFLDPGTEHWIEVRSYTGVSDNRTYSDPCRVEFTTETGQGQSVTNLTAEPYMTSVIKLSWDSPDEMSAYKVESSTDGIHFNWDGNHYGFIPGERTVHYIQNLNSDTEYYFKVTAVFYKYNSETDTYISDTVSSFTMLPRVQIKGTNVINESIKVSWGGVDGAGYYSIFRKENSASEFVPLDIVPASENLEYTDTTALPGRLYYYAVHGCRTNVLTDKQGDAYNYYGACIPLGQVNNLTVSSISSNGAVLSWDEVRGAQSYIIKQYNSTWTESTELGRTDPSNTSYVLAGLTANTQYQIGVAAYTDYYQEGDEANKTFTTTEADPVPATSFTITDNEKTYTGVGQGVTVSCSIAEIAEAGYTVSYQKSGDASFTSDLPKDAGTYQIQIKTTATAGYKATTLSDNSWTLTINKAALNVSANAKSITYGDDPANAGVTYEGFVANETSTVLGGTLSFNYGGYTKGSNAGNYTITPGGLTSDNYTITYENGILTVNPKDLTITAESHEFTYTGEAQSWNKYTTEGLVGNDKVSAVVTGSITLPSQSAVTNELTSYNFTLGNAANYNVITVDGELTMKKASVNITITAGSGTWVYDGTAHSKTTVSVTEGSLLSGDSLVATASGSVTKVSGTSAGNNPVTAGYKVMHETEDVTENYNITTVAGTLTITPKTVSVNGIKATTRDYDPENLTVALTEGAVSGKIGSDNVTVDLSSATGTIQDADAGTNKPVSVAGVKLGGTDAGNYVLSGQPNGVTVTINRINYTGTKSLSTTVRSGRVTTNTTLTLPALPEGAVYASTGTVGGTTAALISGTPSISGRTLTFSTTSQNDQAAATITVAVSGAKNYLDYDVVVSVTARNKDAVEVSVNGGLDKTVTYGTDPFELTQNVTDNENGTWTWTSSNTDVATVEDGTVTVLKAGETDITAAFESETHIGSAAIKLTVNKKPVTITGLSVADKEYDGTAEATVTGTAVVSGKVDSDIVNVIAGTASFSDADAGAQKSVSFNGFSLSGTNAGNYVLSAQPSNIKAAITAKEVVLDWEDTEFTYDGESHCPKATVTNLLAGDSCSVNVSGARTDANPEGSPYTATATGLTNNNYRLPSATADKTTSFNIAKAALALTSAPEAITGLIYDGTEQALVSGGSVSVDTIDIHYAVTKTAAAPAAGSYSAGIPAETDAGVYYVWYKVPESTNYSGIPAASLNVTIDKRVVSVNGIKAKDKIYDATTTAQIDVSTIVITGRKDDQLGVTADLEFEDADAGNNKTVIISNIRLTGSTSANYLLSDSGIQTTVAANISKRKATVTALDQEVVINEAINGSVSMARLTGAVEGHKLYSVTLTADDTSHKTSSGIITAKDATISSNDTDVTSNYEIKYENGNLVVNLGQTATVTAAPQEKTSLSYNGAEQELVTAGTATGGTLKYVLGEDADNAPDTGWNNTIPKGENVNTYYVWYMAAGDNTHDDSEPACVEVTIAKRAVTVKALDQTVSLNSAINGSVSMASLNGAVDGHTLYDVRITAGSTEHATNAGEITVSAAVIRKGSTDVTSNYDVTYEKGVLTVMAAEAEVTTAPTAKQLVYNAEAQQLVSANGAATGGELRYALSTNGVTAPTEGFDAAIPSATDAGTYHVWYMAEGDDDHESTTPVCVDVTISPAEYTVRYDKNDGSGDVVSQNETIGKAGDKALISINGISREGYMLNGWNDKADGSGKTYVNGDEYVPVRKADKSFADLTVYAQWVAVSLNSISINTAPKKTEYQEGEVFDPAGMVVMAYYTDDSSKTVTAYTWTPDGSLAISDNKIVVSYTEGDITCTAEQPISVREKDPEPVSLNSISINKAPDKTEYLEGEKFDPTGMVVMAYYTDDTSKEVTSYTYTPDSALKLTDDKVTITYSEGNIICTAVQKISVSVNEPEVTISLNSISIITPPAKTAYKEGEKFDPAGMVVKAFYTDGSTKIVTTYTYAPDGELTKNDKIITVSYTEEGITCTAEQKISVSHLKTEEEEIITEDEEYFIWNLYEDSEPKALKIKGVSVNEVVKNSNSKSAVYYTASLSGNTISVSVKGELKKAAKAENTLLEFKTADGTVIEYTLPVEYKKPELKLSAASVTIKRGVTTNVETTVLRKTPGGNYEPLDLSGATVKYSFKTAEIKEDGVIAIIASATKTGKISISGAGWNPDDPVELKFSIKAVDKDVLTVDMGGAKSVVINKNVKNQKFEFPVYLNGEKAEKLYLVDNANTGLASYASGVLTIAYPAGRELKPKTYTISLSNGTVKTSVKIQVSNKDLSKAISLKVQSKYDVVTGQKMVIIPKLKDVDGEITGVSISDKDYSAVLNEAGNIVVDYKGTTLNAKNLKMGDLTFGIRISDVDEVVSVTIKNVKAKKSSVTVKAAKVSLKAGSTGIANIVCSYKDAAGARHLILPTETTILKINNVYAELTEDPAVISISNLTKKSGSVKLQLEFPGGVTKKVTVKVVGKN